MVVSEAKKRLRWMASAGTSLSDGVGGWDYPGAWAVRGRRYQSVMRGDGVSVAEACLWSRLLRRSYTSTDSYCWATSGYPWVWLGGRRSSLAGAGACLLWLVV